MFGNNFCLHCGKNLGVRKGYCELCAPIKRSEEKCNKMLEDVRKVLDYLEIAIDKDLEQSKRELYLMYSYKLLKQYMAKSSGT